MNVNTHLQKITWLSLICLNAYVTGHAVGLSYSQQVNGIGIDDAKAFDSNVSCTLLLELKL